MISLPVIGVRTEAQHRCLHSHLRLLAARRRPRRSLNRVQRMDPSRTLTLRRRFEAELVRRFMALRKAIIEVVGQQDVFGIEKRPDQPPKILALPGPRAFAFNTASEKVEAFRGWLAEQVQSGVLGVSTRPDSPAVRPRQWYADTYISSAYKRGLQRGVEELKRAGIPVSMFPGRPMFPLDALFNRPIHADRVAAIYTRAFTELNGITAAMDQQISRTLAQGITDGLGPMEMARQMADRVDAIGITRARMLARTEVMRAHHVANIAVYREAGVEGVEVEVEWKTAGDARVCDRCEEMEGNRYTLDEIEGMIPLHPNCRCVAIPIPMDTQYGLPLGAMDEIESGFEVPENREVLSTVMPGGLGSLLS